MHNIYKMCCNSDLHNELINMNEGICHFCDKALFKVVKTDYQCCSKQFIIKKNGCYICNNCGIVNGYENIDIYINFYDNLYKIHKKSIYKPKYHLENILNKLKYNHNMNELNINVLNKINKIFNEIYLVKPLFNKNRVRIINMNFILVQIFTLLNISTKKLKLKMPKGAETIKYYKNTWTNIMSLIGDKIISIIDI